MPNDQVTPFPAIRLAESPQADTPAQLCCRKLNELSDRLDQFHAFGKGRFVKWKSGLKNRKFPEYGEPAIVTAVLPSPVFDPSEVSSASPYFQEPLSIIIGTYRDDDFLEFRVDGRRFRAVRILNLSGALVSQSYCHLASSRQRVRVLRRRAVTDWVRWPPRE